MELLQSWKESLSLLKPAPFKLFCQVTAKSAIETYTILIRLWWWLIVPSAAVIFVAHYFENTDLFYGSKLLAWVVSMLFLQLIFLILCLTIRPSVSQKNYSYFVTYLKTFWYLIPLKVALIPIAFDYILFTILFTLFTFFVLDSAGTMKAVYRSFVRTMRMFFYNLPLFLLVYLMLAIINLLIYLFVVLGVAFIAALLALLLFPLELCVVANIYVKKLHEQSVLYFDQPS